MGANRLPLQAIQDDYRVRMKFAVTAPDNLQRYRGEAITEYVGFFDDPTDFPPEWRVSENGGVDVGEGVDRPAWRLSAPTGDVLAVQHEDGLELLLQAIGAVGSVAGVVQLGLALWDRWLVRRRNARPSAPPPPAGKGPSVDALVVDCRSKNPNGVITQWQVTVPQALVKHELVTSVLNDPHCPG
jgi:hypothetical protein